MSKPTPASKSEVMIALNMLLYDRRFTVGHHPNPMCVSLTSTCVHCHKTHTIGTVPISGLIAYLRDGVHVQNAFPTLSSDDREFFISRTCPTCWARIFPPNLSEDNTDEFPLPSDLD